MEIRLTEDKYNALHLGCVIVAEAEGMELGGSFDNFWIDFQKHCLVFAKAHFVVDTETTHTVKLCNGFTNSQFLEIIDIGEESTKRQEEASDRVKELIPKLTFK